MVGYWCAFRFSGSVFPRGPHVGSDGLLWLAVGECGEHKHSKWRTCRYYLSKNLTFLTSQVELGRDAMTCEFETRAATC